MRQTLHLPPTEDRRSFKTHTWAQSQFLTSPAPELLYTGPLGSLKSRTLTEKADLRCRLHPRARVALTRKHRVDLGLTTLRTLLEHTISARHRVWGWRPGADGGSTLFYPNGSEILCVGLDNPGKLFSAEFDMILVDQCEEITAEEWDGAQGRLRHRPSDAAGGLEAYRQIAGACNPSDVGHFLYGRFAPDDGSHRQWSDADVELPTREIVPRGTLIRETVVARPTDGRDLLPRDYLARLERFRGRYRERYVLGRWVTFEGSVYGEVWEPSEHLVVRPSSWDRWRGYPPMEWPRYRAIDFGYTNPFVCQWWAQDPDGHFWRYRELYMTRRTVPEHKRTILEAERLELDALSDCEANHKRLPYLPIGLSVSDHDAGDRALLEDGRDGGIIVTVPADKAVTAGLQTIHNLLAHPTRLHFVKGALLERDDMLGIDGAPTCTEEEIPRYRFRKPVESVAAAAPAEDPFKKDDHGCDAMRYLFHTLAGSIGSEMIVV